VVLPFRCIAFAAATAASDLGADVNDSQGDAARVTDTKGVAMRSDARHRLQVMRARQSVRPADGCLNAVHAARPLAPALGAPSACSAPVLR
jgi:hypothetical protein